MFGKLLQPKAVVLLKCIKKRLATGSSKHIGDWPTSGFIAMRIYCHADLPPSGFTTMWIDRQWRWNSSIGMNGDKSASRSSTNDLTTTGLRPRPLGAYSAPSRPLSRFNGPFRDKERTYGARKSRETSPTYTTNCLIRHCWDVRAFTFKRLMRTVHS